MRKVARPGTVLLAFAIACAREPATERAARSASGTGDSCAGSVAPQALPALVALRDTMGLLRLPRGLWAREFNDPRASLWIGRDSTELFAISTDTTPAFAAGADETGLIRRVAGGRFTTESTCQLTIEGRTASLERRLFVHPSGADSVFSMTGTVTVRQGRVLTLFGAAPNATMRDSLIAAFVGLTFPGR